MISFPESNKKKKNKRHFFFNSSVPKAPQSSETILFQTGKEGVSEKVGGLNDEREMLL